MQANTFASKMMTWRMWMFAVVLAGLVAGAAPATDITGVNVANRPDRVVITVDGNGPIKMSVLPSAKGNYLGFQFAGSLLAKGRVVGIHSGKIYSIRYSRFAERPPLTRVVVNTAAHLDYSTQWNDSKTRVEITVWKYGPSRGRANSQPAANGNAPTSVSSPAEPAAVSPPAEPVEPVSNSQEPADTTIVAVKPAAAPVVVVSPAPPARTQTTEVKPAAPAPTMVAARPVPSTARAMTVARVAPAADAVRAPQTSAPSHPSVPISRSSGDVSKGGLSPAKPASLGAGKAISLNFLAADIDDVLKAIAVQSGENIVVGSDVTGKITVTLDKVTVDEALDYITQLTGYTYVKDQHTYLVGSAETVGGLSNARVEIVTLFYANADDVLEMLKAQCPQIRASKISVRGGRARKHEQTFEQGKTKSDASGQANVNSQGQANMAAAGQADASAQGSQDGANKTGSGAASVNAAGAAAGQANTNAQANMNVNAKRGTESLASSTATDSPPSDMIAIVGAEQRIADAKAFIAQVEEAMKGQAADRKISIYQVKYVNTQELANTLMALVMGVTVTLAPSSEGSPVSAAQGQKIVPVSLISGEKMDRPFDTEKNAFSQALIIVGKAEDVQKALDTAAQFDVPGETNLATYRVKYVDPDLLAKTIRRLVPAVYVEGLGITDATGGASAAPAAPSASTGSTPSASGAGSQTSTMSAAMVNNLCRTLVITGRKGDVEKAKTLAESLDVKSPQIRIEAKITSLTESGEKQLGLSWSWGSISFSEAFTDFSTATSSTPNGGENIHNVKRASSQWLRQPLNFAAKLDALLASGQGKLLAAPSMVCLEGKPGQFFVGDQIRYLVMVQQTQQGANVQTETANVGVQLSVVGNVSDDGYITLNLHPEVSVVKLDQTNIEGVGALTLPTITRRYTDHVVRVKDGATIVIGGLINDQDVTEMTKVPILGDLPVLGNLFRHTHKTKDHSEVVIFITASIVND